MLVGLHGKRLEPPLVQVPRAARVMLGMPAHGVGVCQPAEKPGQFAIGLRPEHEMPVIGHHAVRQESYRRSLLSFLQRTHEGSIGLRVFEHSQSTNAAIQNVKNDTSAPVKASPWHSQPLFNSLANQRRAAKIGKLLPASFRGNHFTASATKPAVVPEPVAVTMNWRPDLVRYVIGVADGWRGSVRCQSS